MVDIQGNVIVGKRKNKCKDLGREMVDVLRQSKEISVVRVGGLEIRLGGEFRVEIGFREGRIL